MLGNTQQEKLIAYQSALALQLSCTNIGAQIAKTEIQAVWL